MRTTDRKASTFSWLDTDDAQTRRVREAIALLDEKNASDPLGTGTVRDTFAEALFPGTSTVQTRLRYFLFIPWLCQALEGTRPDRRRFDQQLRGRELKLLEALRRSAGPGEGVIGYLAGPKLTRLPSSVYWHGLGAWQIRREASLSLSAYRDVVTRRLKAPRRGAEPDLGLGPRMIWDPGLPHPPEGFPDDEVGLRTTLDEAEYLQDRMAQTSLWRSDPGGTPSMLAAVAERPEPWLDAAAPWDGPVDELSEPIAELLRHAELFSLAVHGAQLTYNALLCEKAERDCRLDSGELSTWVAESLDIWVQAMTARAVDLRRWWSRPDDFWDAVLLAGGRVRFGTHAFLSEWITAAVRDPHGTAADGRLTHRLVEQERSLKGRYARLSNLTALQSWRGNALTAGRLVYRWPTVRRLLVDLSDGLAGGEPDAGA